MMKTTTLITLALAGLFLACTTHDGKRAINVKVDGATAGQTVYFDRFQGNKLVHMDSAKLDANGAATLRIPVMPTDAYWIGLNEAEKLIVLLDSADEVTLETSTKAFTEPTKVEGSKATMDFYSFERAGLHFQQQRDSLRTKLNASGGDPAVMDAFNKLNQDFYDKVKSYLAENPGSPATLLIVRRLSLEQDMDSYQKVRDNLKTVMSKSGFYGNYRDQVDRKVQEMAQQKAQQEQMARLSNLIPIGSEAPDISMKTPEGGTLALSSLRGKIVLIDFWASWCGPCIREMPNVKAAYDKYKGHGFEIFGVSLDQNQAAWENAIKTYQLEWKHVSDLGGWNNAAAQAYGVGGIPYSVLIDKAGKVLAKGEELRGPGLEKKLAEVL